MANPTKSKGRLFVWERIIRKRGFRNFLVSVSRWSKGSPHIKPEPKVRFIFPRYKGSVMLKNSLGHILVIKASVYSDSCFIGSQI